MQGRGMQKAPVNGVDIEYDVQGAGEAVLFVSPVLADGFLPVLSEPALAGRYQLITYHRRGWAGSTHTSLPVSIGDHARDAAGLLLHLGISEVHVVGHSSGAAVALQLAIDQPTLVHSLSLLELSLLAVPSGEAFLQQVAPAFEAYGRGDHAQALATFMSVVSGLEWHTCRELLNRRVPGVVAQSIADADTFFGVELPALAQWAFGPEQAPAIKQPVLSVLGADTQPLWIEVADQLRSWWPVEELRIGGAGHLLHIQQPTPVAQGLSEFLLRHPMTNAAQAGAPTLS